MPNEAKEAPRDAAKGAPAPGVKKGKPEEDGEEKEAAPVLKQKTLPTGLSRAVVIAAVFASFAILVSSATELLAGRYDLVPAPNSTNSYMYRIDRLTGSIKFCGPQACTDVKAFEEK
jgi:hypothetical protein